MSVKRAPALSVPLRKILSFFDRIFDWGYTSSYNPLYRSGTLASGLLFFVIITGFYLLFFYRLSTPFESIQNIQNNIWFGSLVRALHRYASDLAVVAVGFHALRMIVEGKTWGPRLLAWISGVLMLAVLFLSGWTGYVMVWDRHGQKLAIMGANLIDSLGLLSEPISRAFNGVTPVLSSFFFMNLFLHVALPLGMILALYIHTSKLARASWVPIKPIAWFAGISLTVLSLVWPAPIAGAPDLFAMKGIEPTDWFYNFWMYLDDKVSPGVILSLWIGFFLFLISMSFWWKPKQSELPKKSEHNQKLCEGCQQCAEDCPFEAISMVPRTEGTGSAEVAAVNPALCVACGLCAGSCSQLAIGPPDRNARVQLQKVKELRAHHKEGKMGIAFIACSFNFDTTPIVKWAQAKNIQLDLLAFDCMGSVHPAVVQTLLLSYEGVFCLSCPAQLCQNREGYELFNQRVLGGRNPAQPEKMPASRIYLSQGTLADLSKILAEIETFSQNLKNPQIQKTSGISFTVFQWAKAAVFTVGMLVFIGYISRMPMGVESRDAFVRISWKAPRQVIKDCRKLTPEEIQKLPMHMRRLEECTSTSITYSVQCWVNDKLLLEKNVESRGARHDRPLYVDEVIKVQPGENRIRVKFAPVQIALKQKFPSSLEFDFKTFTKIEQGRAVAISWDANQGAHLKK